MQFSEWLGTASHGLKQWFIAQCYDALIVGAMWGVGLSLLHVPLALLWALLGAAFQFIPNLGPVLTLIGPALAIFFSGRDWTALLWLMAVYAVIAAIDGFILQPYLMKRAARVPFWASLLAPIALGIIIPFWGVLLAPPLLAIVYTFRNRDRTVNL